jgi:hypothetical protein
MNWVHHDLQMSERNIKISTDVSRSESRSKLDKSSADVVHAYSLNLSSPFKNTPMVMSYLSHTLSNMSNDVLKLLDISEG